MMHLDLLNHCWILYIKFLFLIETELRTELRQLYRRFEHSFVRRLHQVLQRSDYEVELHVLEHLTKYCEHCQKHERSSDRFSFIIIDNIDFNHNIIVDILYIQNQSMLHLVDETIRFQTKRWLKNIFVNHVWDQLRICWIYIYLDFFDLISIDADRQFMTQKFK